MKRLLVIGIACVLVLSACSKAPDEETPTEGTAQGTVTTANSAEVFTDRDKQDTYDETEAVLITLKDGENVTITEAGTYVLSGTLTDGSVVVNAAKTDKLQLVLNGVSITAQDTAALHIVQADKVVVTLEQGTVNTLANGGTFTGDDNVDGAVFSKEDLTFNGKGALTVTSPAGHGIVCKDDLVFTGGTYTITAASHGLDANDSIRVSGSTIKVDTGKDGFHAENDEDTTKGYVHIVDGTLSIEAEGDGISSSAYVQIDGGTLDLLCGGGYENAEKKTSDGWGGFGGMPPKGGHREMNTDTSSDSTSIKGIKAGTTLVVSGGDISINSADDAMHANGSITISGGKFTISTGDDGFHADDTVTVQAGDIRINTCYEGLEAQHVTVAGGTVWLKASDDGFNAAGGTDSSGSGGMRPGGDRFGGGGGGSSNGSITVSGGDLYIHSSGDGMDANGTLTISGGHTVIVGPTQGDTATLDYDVSGTITGGTFMGTGASGMAQTFSDSKQGVIAVNVGNQAANTAVTIKTKDGKSLLSHTPELSFAVVIFSSPELKAGESYTLTVGTLSDTVTAD